MTDTSDLVERLKDIRSGSALDIACELDDLCQQAAIALTAQAKEIEALRGEIVYWENLLKSRDDTLNRALGRTLGAEARAETAERRVAELEGRLDTANQIDWEKSNRLISAERERDEARAALKPLSDLHWLIDDMTDSPDDAVFFQHDGTIITFGQIRAARAVIKQGE